VIISLLECCKLHCSVWHRATADNGFRCILHSPHSSITVTGELELKWISFKVINRFTKKLEFNPEPLTTSTPRNDFSWMTFYTVYQLWGGEDVFVLSNTFVI